MKKILFIFVLIVSTFSSFAALDKPTRIKKANVQGKETVSFVVQNKLDQVGYKLRDLINEEFLDFWVVPYGNGDNPETVELAITTAERVREKLGTHENYSDTDRCASAEEFLKYPAFKKYFERTDVKPKLDRKSRSLSIDVADLQKRVLYFALTRNAPFEIAYVKKGMRIFLGRGNKTDGIRNIFYIQKKKEILEKRAQAEKICEAQSMPVQNSWAKGSGIDAIVGKLDSQVEKESVEIVVIEKQEDVAETSDQESVKEEVVVIEQEPIAKEIVATENKLYRRITLGVTFACGTCATVVGQGPANCPWCGSGMKFPSHPNVSYTKKNHNKGALDRFVNYSKFDHHVPVKVSIGARQCGNCMGTVGPKDTVCPYDNCRVDLLPATFIYDKVSDPYGPIE
ncbi:hypothetical protein OAB57_01915 [Bacteriovoracaceae bacterium]|nr:hypothetical protein [Bacteriovoracaceae bacterium]